MRNRFVAAVAALFFSAAATAAPVSLPGWQSTIKYTSTSPTSASYFGNFARATSSVVYDSATGTYTLRDTGNISLKSTFGPANINSAASDATFTVYKKGSGSSVETFRRLNLGAGNPLIVLSYVDYGQWRRTSPGTGGSNVNDTYLVFGNRTPAASVPKTGSGSYTTIVDGTFVNKNGVYAVSGSGTFTANFGANSIAYNQTATGSRESGGSSINFGTLTGAGSISTTSRGFAGTGTANAEGYKLDVNGNFYGPAAQELGGVFKLSGNGGNGTGAIVGHQ